MFGRLIQQWKDGRRAWAGFQAFNALPRSRRKIVFYAETAADWAYLGPTAAALEKMGRGWAAVCSDPRDPALARDNAFYVGFGMPRTALFRNIDADAFVMTLPDIETFQLKRSVNPVHYFYIFHSIASMHRVYREHAMDGYDTILCVGPHHEREIRKTEEVYGLEPKRLLKHGYSRLDTLMHDVAAFREAHPGADEVPGNPLRVLVAPTWGECSLVEHGLEGLLDALLRAGFQTTLRLHTMTKRHKPGLVPELMRRFGAAGLAIDPDINTTQALVESDIMVSEWSGSPLEYAFALLKPVIFVDTPPKVHNPAFGKLGLPCLEEEIRGLIGEIVPEGRWETLPDTVRRLVAARPEWKDRIAAVRDATVYNLGRSGEAGAEGIVRTLGELGKGG
ncbi:MAG: hypothetical protein IKQ55_02280 [Kiritimatiellae bacterium]|nr:hypothetical protein [Kiritimatiellia bacterium]